MKLRNANVAALALGLVLTASSAFAADGQAIVDYFYQTFGKPLGAAGILVIIVGAIFQRSHIFAWTTVGLALLCLGNYQTILGLFGI